MSSIGDVNANELLNLDLIDLESCFDPLFYPSEDFENTSDDQRKENTPFACKGKYKIGNTFYLVETEYDGAEPLPHILKRLIFPTEIYPRTQYLISKNFSDKEADW